MSFQVLATCPDSQARAGVLRASRGAIHTPAFMPVGTQATVKALSPDELRLAGAECLLANTYHLALRPGADLIQRLGGLHAYMAWPGPILTDSGGFQVMSLGRLRLVADQGVLFRSHLDGSSHFFTPERVVSLQRQLGSDIAMVLDECTAYPCTWPEAFAAVERTSRWAARSRHVHTSPGQLLFAIVQGSTYADLRQRSAAELAALEFDGYAIGGLSVGEPRSLTLEMLGVATATLPPDRPRYLMGVGSPLDVVACVDYGVDLFDSVLPTRLGRHGVVFTEHGRLDLRRSVHAAADRPIEAGCPCYACSHLSLAYLHHLQRSGEPLASRLASLHNLTFLLRLVRRLRQAILDGTYPALRQLLLERWGASVPLSSAPRT